MKNFFSFITFFVILILPSPLLYSIGLRVRWGSFILIAIYIFYTFVCFKKTNNILFSLFLLFITAGLGTVTALHYISTNYIVILSALIGYTFFYTLLDDEQIKNFTQIASIFLVLVEIGALIGFIYVLIGGTSIFFIENPDSRQNWFYLSTFSNARLGKFIRPAGIYDEPGAFSFYICAVSALRIHYNKNPFLTFLMMLLGLITTSLTHFICFFLFLIPIFRKCDHREKVAAMFIFIVLLIFVFTAFYDIFDKLLFQRLKIDSSTGTIEGNSRNGQIEGCLKSIKENGMLFGNYLLGADGIRQRYGTIGENPLSCLALNGLFNSIPYYTLLLVSFLAFFCTFKVEYLVVLLLFMQRPYQSQLGYSFFFVHYLFLSIQEIKLFLTNNQKWILLSSRED